MYRIDNISLKNFWCYDNQGQTFRFGQSATVVIGLNGAGKTAFLTAVRKGLSFILSTDRRKDIRFVGDGKDVREAGLKVSDVRYNYTYGLIDDDYHYPVELVCEGVMYGRPIRWSYNKFNKRSAVDKQGYREALDFFLNVYNGNPTETVLPLLAFFSDSYPHVRNSQTRYEKDILIDKKEQIERRAGYYRWDHTSTDFYFWRDLFINTLSRLEHKTTGYDQTIKKLNDPDIDAQARTKLQRYLESLESSRVEVEYVISYMRRVSKTFLTRDNSDLAVENISVGSYLDDGKKEVFTLLLEFKDGHRSLFDKLPEGYKRLLAIAFEIVYRFFILNRIHVVRNPGLSPQGIVIIDELELHLHPTLAQESLIRLMKAFPELQFIVSTHSPAIVSNIHNDGVLTKVVRLNPDHSFEELGDCYGADYGDTLVRSMGSYGRLHELEVLEELYREAYYEGDKDGMEQTKKELLDFYYPAHQAQRWMEETVNSWEQQIVSQ